MASTLLDALLSWFSSCFALPSTWSGRESEPLARILYTIDPAHFTAKWVDTIKIEVPSENKRLLTNNVKKLLNALVDYYQEVLQSSLQAFPLPDPTRVVDQDPRNQGRLLQLVMGCAVNCDAKETYIASIMHMEESVQQVIMQAIQELLDLPGMHQAEASLPGLTQTDLRKLMDDLAKASEEKDELKQRCHDLENQIELLKDEKLNISAEYEQLQAQVSGKPTRDDRSLQHTPGGINIDLKKRMEAMQDGIFKLESQKEELQVKVDHLEKQVEESQTKEAELQKTADQALKLKDEVDILRETSDKAAKYEVTIDSYKKKLEDMSDLKRQLKILEEKNTEFMQRNMDLEEDVKKTGNWRPQVDAYKKQIAELHAKLDSESKKSDRLEFETKRLLEKVESLGVEKDRLQTEREELKSRNDELMDEIKFGQATSEGGVHGGLDGEPDSGTLEMIPPSIKERLLRLQRENKRLLVATGGLPGKEMGEHSGNIQVLQSMIDTMKDRAAELEDANRQANQKILELESKLEDGVSSGEAPRIPGSREELELKLADNNKKINSLNEAMHKKDLEIQAMEERYKRYIEKAKSVIKTFEPKHHQSAQSVQTGGAEVALLRSQLTEKDRIIETMETEKARAVREMEERLISSAFYNISMQMHRNAVENRLGGSSTAPSSQTGGVSAPGALPGSGSGPVAQQQAQSFLARQRQVNHRTRSGPSSSDFMDY